MDENSYKHLSVLPQSDLTMTEIIKYLKRHVNLLKHPKNTETNLGVVWCLEQQINKIEPAYLGIKEDFQSHMRYLEDAITKYKDAITSTEQEVCKLKKDIKILCDLSIEKQTVAATWISAMTKSQEHSNNQIKKLDAMQEKLEQFVSPKLPNLEDKSTMTGKSKL